MKYRSLSLFLLFLFLGAQLFPAGSELKLVKAIGDDRDDYTFFRLNSAVMSDKKEIFVSDIKGHFIAKYDWQGKFIKRIGQFGQGNQDLNRPTSLYIADSKLYLLDFGNYRIAWTNLDLSRLDYFKYTAPSINMKTLFRFNVLRHGQCLGSSSMPWENRNRIVVYDWISGKFRAFFNHFPTDPGNLFEKKSNKKTKEQIEAESRIAFPSLPIFGYDKKRGELLVSYQYPDNPIMFYLYTKEGKEIMAIKYPIEKQYKFHKYYLSNSIAKSRPAESYEIVIDGIFPYKDKFLVFFVKIRQQRGKYGEIVEHPCLVIDRNGKIVEKFLVESGLTVFFISEDGYVIGKDFDADEEQILIYKLNLRD